MHGQQIQSLVFCLRSLWKDYGLGFVRRVVLPHPFLTFRGMKRYFDGHPEILNPGPNPVLGLGFCLKPMDPACLSGRFNHACHYFERNLNLESEAHPLCCRECVIRSLGEMALKAGYSLYIMTSARDILHDLLLPAFKEKRFSYALLGLCAYSFEPFRIAMSVVGLEGELIPFTSGDCQDYRSWRLADTGIKEERTKFDDSDIKKIEAKLAEKTEVQMAGRSFSKQGHVFCQKP